MARGYVSRICDGMVEVRKILTGMHEFLPHVKVMSLRKQQAEKILQAYGTTGRSAMLFKMLDNRVLDADDYKKLLYQVLKQ